MHHLGSQQIELLPSKEMLDDISLRYHTVVTGYFAPCESIGGDLWGTYPINENNFAIYNIDVSGHGVAAALNVFRLHDRLMSNTHLAANPGAILTELNSDMHEWIGPGRFATMFFGVVDITKNHIEYAAAAAPKPFLFSTTEKAVTMIDSSGIPLGALPDVIYENRICEFHAQDTLILYSDALIETTINEDGDFAQEEDISTALTPILFDTARNIKTRQHDALRAIRTILHIDSGNSLNDDFTLALFSRTE